MVIIKQTKLFKCTDWLCCCTKDTHFQENVYMKKEIMYANRFSSFYSCRK